MSMEIYRYDEAVGLYGFESLRRMAQAAIREVARYEDVRAAGVPADLSDVLYDPAPTGEFRLSTLASANEPVSHALATTPYEPTGRKEIGATYYKLDFNVEAPVLPPKSFTVPVPYAEENKRSAERYVKDLMVRFDRSELEAIMRMAGKLTRGLEIAQELSRYQEEPDTDTQQFRALSDLLPKVARLRQLSALEPHTFRALQSYKLDALREGFPTKTAPSGLAETEKQSDTTAEDMHILEWKEFLDLARTQFRRESDDDPKALIALQYVADANHCFINLESRYGSLSQIEILRYDDNGIMRKKNFDLRSEADEDDIERLRVGSFWDQQELLACLREGQPMPQKLYRSYSELAIADSSSQLASVIDIKSRKKAV